jgi:hypothetical protein
VKICRLALPAFAREGKESDVAGFDHESLECGDGDSLESEIIDSARDDVPPPQAREQLLAALNLAPSSGPTEQPSPLRAAGAVHARVVGLALALGAGVAIVVSMSSGGDPVASAPNVAAVAPLEAVAPKETQEPIAAPEEVQAETERSPEPSRQATPARTTPASVRQDAVGAGAERAGHAARSASTAARLQEQEAAAPAPSTLGRELARVTAARSALAEGEAARSLQMLDAYDAEFPAGAFSVEVAVLRVEALARSGHAEDARRLGNRFLAQHPDGLFARRVAATLRSVSLVEDDPSTPTR